VRALTERLAGLPVVSLRLWQSQHESQPLMGGSTALNARSVMPLFRCLPEGINFYKTTPTPTPPRDSRGTYSIGNVSVHGATGFSSVSRLVSRLGGAGRELLSHLAVLSSCVNSQLWQLPILLPSIHVERSMQLGRHRKQFFSRCRGNVLSHASAIQAHTHGSAT
jgi:hypothetical protein